MGDAFQNLNSTTFLGAEHHVINYPINALDDEKSIKSFLLSLQHLFITGDVAFPQLPQPPISANPDNKQNNNINGNKQIKTMKRIRLKESQLRQIIYETLNSLDTSEGFYEDNLNEEDLVKVADKGDYQAAFIDYLKEKCGLGDDITLNWFIKHLRNGDFRYRELSDGIYYINDYNDSHM